MEYVIGITKKGRQFMFEYLGNEYLLFDCACGHKNEAFMPYLLDPLGFDICLKCELPFRYFLDFQWPHPDEIEELLKVRRHDGYLRGYDLPREGKYAPVGEDRD